MHLPQSVVPSDGGGGADAAAGSGLGVAGALGASAEADAEAADAGVSELADAAEPLAEELSDAELCSGLSGGLDPPPQANQANGKATTRTRAVMGRRSTRRMVIVCVAHRSTDSKHERRFGRRPIMDGIMDGAAPAGVRP